MFGLNPHQLVDRSAIALFENDQLWLHVVAHVVIVIMPVVVLFLLLRWVYLLAKWYFQTQPLKTPLGNGSNRLELPSSLMGFIFKYSGRSQLLLALLALSILPLTYVQLELPKQIINGAISTEAVLEGGWRISQMIERVDYLLLLCGLFLAALAASGILKYLLNLKMGITAESLLRHIRLNILRRQSGPWGIADKSTIVPVLTQEVEPVCSFSGDSVIVPLLHGGTVVTIVTFMMMQNVVLGAAAITLLPIQIFIIPRLQRRINRLVRQRVIAVRGLATALQADDGTIPRKQIREQVMSLYDIRLGIFKLKYRMKSLNNCIMNLTPFFFYTIGGYLVLEDHLSLGALVASLASYKDLAPAIRELFSYYQRSEDAKSRFSEIHVYLNGGRIGKQSIEPMVP